MSTINPASYSSGTTPSGQKGWEVSWDDVKKTAQSVGDWFGGIFGSSGDDKERLKEIDKAIAESKQSPYNEMKASKISVGDELKDYFNRMRSEYGKALYDYRNPTGMAPAEFAASQTRFNQAQNQQQMTAQMAGGGGAGTYIGSVLGNNAADFNLNLAAQNENIKRQNKQIAMSYLSGITGQLGQTAGAMQDIETKNTMLEQEAFAKNFEKQMLAEQALGQARQDWYHNRALQQQSNRDAIMKILQVGTQAAISSSDIRLKKDIIYSHQENGHKIYEFRYTNGDNTRYLGVLAQEVMEINPSAVIQEPNGYYAVNYDMLGITMKKID